MASWQYRFYSTRPREIFDHVGQKWPAALVRRNAWKIGGSEIWYSTVVFDEAGAAAEFQAWLHLRSRRMNIAALVGSDEGYKHVLLHPRMSITELLGLRYRAFRRRWR